jgi:hypothetical protein
VIESLPGWGDVQIVRSPHVPEGTVLIGSALGSSVLVGTRPRTLLEDVRHEARKIVREGMADVLAWLKGTPNDPMAVKPLFDINVEVDHDRLRILADMRVEMGVQPPGSFVKITGVT